MLILECFLFLRDRSGAYLSPIGSKAVLKTRSQTVTKDELFSLEDSLPQASFVAALNGRYVSVKQGEFFFVFWCGLGLGCKFKDRQVNLASAKCNLPLIFLNLNWSRCRWEGIFLIKNLLRLCGVK